MTKEEAITRLKGLYGNGYMEQEQALDMAIRALKNEQTDVDLISRKAVLDTICSYGTELERYKVYQITVCDMKQTLCDLIEELPTIPQTDSVLEDIKAEIEKLPRIKVGNSNSPTVKYCIDERLIYEVVYKHISGKE